MYPIPRDCCCRSLSRYSTYTYMYIVYRESSTMCFARQSDASNDLLSSYCMHFSTIQHVYLIWSLCRHSCLYRHTHTHTYTDCISTYVCVCVCRPCKLWLVSRLAFACLLLLWFLQKSWIFFVFGTMPNVKRKSNYLKIKAARRSAVSPIDRGESEREGEWEWESLIMIHTRIRKIYIQTYTYTDTYTYIVYI